VLPLLSQEPERAGSASSTPPLADWFADYLRIARDRSERRARISLWIARPRGHCARIAPGIAVAIGAMPATTGDPKAPSLRELASALDRAIVEADAPALLILLGELERLKSLLWTRLVSAVAPAGPPPDRGELEGLRHLTPQQVAELLSLTPAYVHELCRTRRLPAIKSGKYWMISVPALRTWLYQNSDIDPAARSRLEFPDPRSTSTRDPRVVRGAGGRQRAGGRSGTDDERRREDPVPQGPRPVGGRLPRR
jgi:excisionase family DNA binding protein